jgi:hypothetical protein
LGSPRAVITDEVVEEVQQLARIDQRVAISTIAEETGMSKQNSVQILVVVR